MPSANLKKQTPVKTGKELMAWTSEEFIARLNVLKSPKELENVQRFFHEEGKSKFIGVKMGHIFKLAKEAVSMPLLQVEKLLRSDFFEARMGAVSIMDFKARDKKTLPGTRKELFDLYTKNHQHINNWDLVDRSAPWVVGSYLMDQPRAALFKLAKSKNVWERRTAIVSTWFFIRHGDVSTWFFIRHGDVSDTFKIAELLVADKQETIQKAVGSWIREAGQRNKAMLLAFLDKHAATMPRVMLRYAVEKLDGKKKEMYMKAAKMQQS